MLGNDRRLLDPLLMKIFHLVLDDIDHNFQLIFRCKKFVVNVTWVYIDILNLFEHGTFPWQDFKEEFVLELAILWHMLYDQELWLYWWKHWKLLKHLLNAKTFIVVKLREDKRCLNLFSWTILKHGHLCLKQSCESRESRLAMHSIEHRRKSKTSVLIKVARSTAFSKFTTMLLPLLLLCL